MKRQLSEHRRDAIASLLNDSVADSGLGFNAVAAKIGIHNQTLRQWCYGRAHPKHRYFSIIESVFGFKPGLLIELQRKILSERSVDRGNPAEEVSATIERSIRLYEKPHLKLGPGASVKSYCDSYRREFKAIRRRDQQRQLQGVRP